MSFITNYEGHDTVKEYRDEIAEMISAYPIRIDCDMLVGGHVPALASSEFLTNREQGDWAERIVMEAINSHSCDLCAVHYGRSDSIAAGDPGFAGFYEKYLEELNSVGKKPDILIFKKSDEPERAEDLERDEVISKAVAALEVRSSSFLSGRYKSTMRERQSRAEKRCREISECILTEPYSSLLKAKSPEVWKMLKEANEETFKNLDFRAVSWTSSVELAQLSSWLKELKENIRILHKRDYLSITPKIEDIALVNRWISKFNVPHFYLQVFFDRAYMISFEDILKISSDSELEGKEFSIESDTKNQGKTTVKVNVDLGAPVIGRIDMPSHNSKMKELDRGRLLFYVEFKGGKGYLDYEAFKEAIGNA